MKQLIKFFPLLVFFIFYKLYDVFIASGALIISSALELVLSYLIYHKVEIVSLVTFPIVAVFGIFSIVFHNPELIKWKVTIIYMFFSLSLLFSHWFMKYTILEKVIGNEFFLPKVIWKRLNIAWALFFLLCGITNIYVGYRFSQDNWITFKVFGLSALTLLFTVIMSIYIYYLRLHTKNNKHVK